MRIFKLVAGFFKLMKISISKVIEMQRMESSLKSIGIADEEWTVLDLILKKMVHHSVQGMRYVDAQNAIKIHAASIADCHGFADTTEDAIELAAAAIYLVIIEIRNKRNSGASNG